MGVHELAQNKSVGALTRSGPRCRSPFAPDTCITHFTSGLHRMKIAKPNAELVWKQLEDFVVPRLALSVTDRAVYSHLLRHSRLEGKLRLRFSIPWLARGVRLTGGPVRDAVRRLVSQDALRLVERSKAGHVTEVRLPEEIRSACREGMPAEEAAAANGAEAQVGNLEEADFMQSRALRQAIHARSGESAFTACGGSLAGCNASTMWCRGRKQGAIRTET